MKKFGYRKSRNGCLLCKKRRVKCDEKRPCGACEKHGVQCSLGEPGESSQSSPEPRALRTTSRGDLPASSAHHSRGSVMLASSHLSSCRDSKQPVGGRLEDVALNVAFIQDPSPGPAEYDQATLIDLELMHHYTTTAYNKFPHVSTRPEYFQVHVPRMALRHGFLLHQILAVSAFHWLHVATPATPSSAYLHRATHHLTKSLSGIRDALTAEMTLERGTALFVASSLLLSSTYASRRHVAVTADDAAAATDAIDDSMSMVTLYRGIGAIQSAASEQLSKDLFQEVFGDNMRKEPVMEPWVTDYSRELEALKSHVAAHPELTEATRKPALSGIQVLLDAAWSQEVSKKAIISSIPVRILYRWPFWIADDFLQLVRDREPVGLVIFLFYCVVVRQAQKQCWFLTGWASRLAAAASEPLQGSPWLQRAQWAINTLAVDAYMPRSTVQAVGGVI